MTAYKELLMRRDAFNELRLMIDVGLNGDQVRSLQTDIDEVTGDLLVTGEYEGVRRTHRITITEETTP